MTDDGRQVMAKAHVAFGKVSQKLFLLTWRQRAKKGDYFLYERTLLMYRYVYML
jgi:hypothetical protein